MANYTTRVYDILNSLNNNTISGYSINKVIEEHWEEIFDLNIWNTFDENYKKTLCCKILRHYLMYEIGSETVALWKFNLNSHLAEIMPKYNAMYANIEKAYENFFSDTNYSENVSRETTGNSEENGSEKGNSEGSKNTSATSNETGKTTANGTSETKTEQQTTGEANTESTQTSNSKGTANSDAWQASSDTPQGGLNGLENNTYLSSAVHNYGNTENTGESGANTSGSSTNTGTATNNGSGKTTSEGSTENESNATGTEKESIENSKETTKTGTNETTENYVKNVIGKMGSENNAKLFNEICQSLVNVDLQIINELKEDFILLWE